MQGSIYGIFALCLALFLFAYIVSILQVQQYSAEPFLNYPQQVDPTKVIPSNPDAEQMNGNWRLILEYISKNPTQGLVFVQELRKLFFDETACRIKQPRIDFLKVADSYHPVFK